MPTRSIARTLAHCVGASAFRRLNVSTFRIGTRRANRARRAVNFPPVFRCGAPRFREPGHAKNPTKTRTFSACDTLAEFGYITRPLPPRPRHTRRARPLSTQPEAPSAQACRKGPGALRATATQAIAGPQEADPKVSFATVSRAQMQRRAASIRNSGFAIRISGCVYRRDRNARRAAWQTDASKLRRDLL
ncbi:hypothetical protein [Burkholderia pyrrocinia]|uniref:hypothetical protein n=1 Tax=Burkholderia pyrrocinia TaxID=60550 RepID=UPI001575B0D9|nr:hypothetical protein [Burkholderia pyrrocinia]